MKTDIESLQKEIAERIQGLPLPGEPAELYAPIAYCLQNGGKRIRPMMTLLACDMFGGDVNQAMSPALGMELLHNFTLLHDDVMDQAPMRRNRPTVHTKWNINTAILSGDALFALACQYVAEAPESGLKEVMQLFHKTVIEICEGQQYDMDFERMPQVTPEDYLKMIRLKTAVLPAASLQVGAIIAGASEKNQELIYGFGEHIGLAFQIKDDWLDIFGDETTFGKKTGGDIMANKKTWPYIQAMEIGGQTQRKTLKEAFSKEFNNREEKIKLVKGIFDQLDISNMSQETMQAHYARAFDHLEEINLPAARKEKLTHLSKALFDRES